MAKLKALVLDRPMDPGRYGDGGGLYLLVGPNGAKSWMFRYRVDGKERQMGLGSYETVSLANARLAAADCRKLRSQGKDPIAERKAAKAQAREEQARSRPFKECAEEFVTANEGGWKNEKHKQQWRNTLATYVYPKIGAVAASAIDRPLILQVLSQQVPAELNKDSAVIRSAGALWEARPETARRVRGRIEQTLDWAKAHGYRDGENPARWKDSIKAAWPNRGRARKKRHHPALPYAQLPAFMAELRKKESVAALALEFCILNAPRTMEVLASRLPEIDRDRELWTLPPERMKAGEEHRVPLTPAALAVLERADDVRTRGDFVFPGTKKDKPLSNMAMLMLTRRMGYTDGKGRPITVHGFRSTFRDWVADCTSFPREVAEKALAHSIGDETEEAYWRSDMFNKRRELMAAWADFCNGKSNVVALAAVAA